MIRLKGKWKEGYAIDMHIISSSYVGDNQYGHPIYSTKRTQIGELIYQLKYQSKQNINDIMELVKPVLDKWKIKEKVDIVIPIPPSDSRRSVQPVFLIAKEIAKHLDIPISTKVLKKTRSEQLKDVDIDRKFDSIKNSIIKEKNFKRRVNILLIDDLYDSGVTLNEAVDILKKDINVNEVYVLVMTKTRRR